MVQQTLCVSLENWPKLNSQRKVVQPFWIKNYFFTKKITFHIFRLFLKNNQNIKKKSVFNFFLEVEKISL